MLAHDKTVADCAKLDIEWQALDKEGNSSYTEKAQDIFNRHFDEIDNCPHNNCDDDAKCFVCGKQQ